MPRRDPVSPELWDQVARRDEWRCMAPVLDPDGAGRCRGPFWSESRTPPIGSEQYRRILTVDHVPRPVHQVQRAPDDPDRGVRRAPSRLEHLVLLCHHHNTGGWASSHRTEERRYLAQLYPAWWVGLEFDNWQQQQEEEQQ